MAGTRIIDQSGYSSNVMMTPFLELVTEQFTNKFAVRPTWGPTELRNLLETTGTGNIDEVDGLLCVASGTTAGSTAKLVTVERGQYVPGGMGQAGMGIQLNEMPTGDAEARWGYYDTENGFGYGIDADGVFVFTRKDSTDTIVRKASFNGEQLDLATQVLEGIVFQINFTWYGFGSVEWRASVRRSGNTLRRMAPLHQLIPSGVSVIDPNQPICVEVDNGTTTQDLQVCVGGRQFATTRKGLPDVRRTVDSLTYTTTVGTGSGFEPILAVRAKSSFRGRTNSTNKVLESFRLQATDDVAYRWLFNPTVSGATYAEATGYPADETTVEWAEPTFTASGGVPFDKGFVLAAQNKDIRAFSESVQYNFTGDVQLVLLVEPLSSNCDLFVTATVLESW